MDKHQLAQELRQRQYEIGLLEKRLIDAISDDQIIDSYITCSCCGEKQVTAQKLETAIGMATDANQFFHFCDGFAHARHQRNREASEMRLPLQTRSARRGTKHKR